MLARLFRKRSDDAPAASVYPALVARARQPRLYAEFGVPDTVPGRFEMVVLHAVVLCHRLGAEGERGKALAQDVFDAFTTDMDRSFREMGIGDLGVPKRMKAVGQSFYGRLASYGTALAARDRRALADGLRRNLFPEDAGRPAMNKLADYGFDLAAALARVDIGALERGEIGIDVAAEGGKE